MSSFDFHPKLFLTNGTIATTGTSANLTAGELGLYDIYTNQVVTVANAATHPAAYIAQGSFYPSDKRGTHGGYKESIKSPAFTKGINPKNVKRFIKIVPRTAVTQKVRLFWDGIDGSTGPQFLCGKNYYMRLEVKGEPVLRMSNRYLYKHIPYFTGCCGNDCSAPCTPEVIDAALVMLGYAKQINEDPQLSKFLVARAIKNVATVKTVIVEETYVSPALPADKALVVAGLEIDVVYDETVWADCSFSQADYYNDKFIEVLASMVYQNGDVCEGGEVIMNHSTGVGFTEVTPFVLPKGSGELILREFIASQLQSGIFFSHDPRSRETDGNIAMTAVSRASTYTKYSLIYSVAQSGNPSNTLSQDQYILNFALKTGDSGAAFEALFLAWLQAHNPALTLETEAGTTV